MSPSTSSGRSTTDLVFYYAFGLFKTAVIAQQIYYRFKQGLTKDPRFGAMIIGDSSRNASSAVRSKR